MRKIITNGQNKALVVSGNALLIEDYTVPSEYTKLTGIVYDGNVYYYTDLILHGSDTLRFSFSVSKACNVLGSYSSADATTNYSLYVTSTSSGKYLRYNGNTYNSYFIANKRYDVVITPTGSTGMETDSTWNAQTFTTVNPMCIGTTSVGATSAKLTGTMYGNIGVDGSALFIPVKRNSDNAIGYYETYTKTFYTNQGSGTPTSLGNA